MERRLSTIVAPNAARASAGDSSTSHDQRDQKTMPSARAAKAAEAMAPRPEVMPAAALRKGVAGRRWKQVKRPPPAHQRSHRTAGSRRCGSVANMREQAPQAVSMSTRQRRPARSAWAGSVRDIEHPDFGSLAEDEFRPGPRRNRCPQVAAGKDIFSLGVLELRRV